MEIQLYINVYRERSEHISIYIANEVSMFLTILIVFLSLIGLMVLHEFGHFILAKKFGVKVEEFGLGYPPRIIGIKFGSKPKIFFGRAPDPEEIQGLGGETIYSLNWLPFGAFVKLPGEIEKIEDSRSFSAQPVSKRILIASGGVFSFWIMAAIILSIVFASGVPTAISDEENIANSKIQIAAIAPNSPAEIAGLKIGDTIKQLSVISYQLSVENVKEVQEFTENNKGKEIILTVERGKQVFDVSLVPRVSPPAGEGAMGVALVRTAIKSYPWYRAPWQGISATGNITILIIKGFYQAISNAVQGLPTGVELIGPVGIGNLFYQAAKLGFSYFLNLLAIISIYLAIFNVLPIPSADGGKLLFLGIEAIRKKPVPQKIEQNITAVSFTAILILMVFVTIKDIARLF